LFAWKGNKVNDPTKKEEVTIIAILILLVVGFTVVQTYYLGSEMKQTISKKDR